MNLRRPLTECKPTTPVIKRFAMVWLFVISSGCAVGQPLSGTSEPQLPKSFTPSDIAPKLPPRPMGVPDDATPERRGAEMLRVIVEILRHGNLRDAEFASRLLGFAIPSEGMWLPTKTATFPQELASGFDYTPGRLGSRSSFSIGFDPQRTCIKKEEVLHAFQQELGVPNSVYPSHGAGMRPLPAPAGTGWRQLSGMPHLSNAEYLSTRLEIGLTVRFSRIYVRQCIHGMDVSNF